MLESVELITLRLDDVVGVDDEAEIEAVFVKLEMVILRARLLRCSDHEVKFG